MIANKNNEASAFPQKYIDQMIAHAESFDPRPFRKDGTHALSFRADTAESAFTLQQLTYIRPGVLEVQYPELKGAQLVPVNTRIDTGAQQHTYDIYDYVGSASITSDMSTRPPRVDVKKSQSTQNIYSVWDAYGYSVQEARAAVFARQPLPQQKAKAARDIIERTLDTIIMTGDALTGMKGLLTLAGTLTYSVPNGLSGVKTWENKTPDEIVADLNGIANGIVTATKEIEQPDTILLPLTSYTLISSRRMGDGDTTTILDHFLKSSPYISTVEASHKCEAAPNSEWTGKRMVAYKKDPNKLEVLMPQLFEQWAPEIDGAETVTICHARIGGIALYYPKSVSYGDGI